jgi:hypothetical protein
MHHTMPITPSIRREILSDLICIWTLVLPIFKIKWTLSFLLVLRVQVVAEIPMDSSEADEENKQANGKTLLYVLERGC